MYHADLAEKESRISKLLGDISMYSIYYQRNLSVMIDSLYPEPYTCRMGLITKAFQSWKDGIHEKPSDLVWLNVLGRKASVIAVIS